MTEPTEIVTVWQNGEAKTYPLKEYLEKPDTATIIKQVKNPMKDDKLPWVEMHLTEVAAPEGE